MMSFSSESVVQILKISNPDLNMHFPDDMIILEKLDRIKTNFKLFILIQPKKCFISKDLKLVF